MVDKTLLALQEETNSRLGFTIMMLEEKENIKLDLEQKKELREFIFRTVKKEMFQLVK